jgi:hypothetical protein
VYNGLQLHPQQDHDKVNTANPPKYRKSFKTASHVRVNALARLPFLTSRFCPNDLHNGIRNSLLINPTH